MLIPDLLLSLIGMIAATEREEPSDSVTVKSVVVNVVGCGINESLVVLSNGSSSSGDPLQLSLQTHVPNELDKAAFHTSFVQEVEVASQSNQHLEPCALLHQDLVRQPVVQIGVSKLLEELFAQVCSIFCAVEVASYTTKEGAIMEEVRHVDDLIRNIRAETA